MAMTRQQLEQQLVAAHRTKNVQAAQQAAYAIRAYDQNVLSAQVPSINAPPPIDRVPKPTFGSYIEDISRGMGRGFVTQMEGMQQLVTHPYDTGKALIQAGVEAVRNPSQAIGEAWSGIKSQAQTAMSSPQGFGQVLGENLDFIPGPGSKRRPTMAELDVYHGTPHTFDPEEGAPLGRFRSEKIGTGEGAQAYGYGLYLAEAPGTAKEYQVKLSSTASAKNAVTKYGDVDSAIKATQESIFNLRNSMERGIGGERVKGMLQIAEKRMDDLQDMKAGRPAREGSLYKVDLPDAKIEQMLDWDKRLSQQPKVVKDAFKKAFTNPEIADDELRAWYQNNPDPTGNALYSQLMTSDMFTGLGQKEASRVLNELGVPGIKYLDAGSRAEGKKTRNFVVFPGEEQSLTILERDGVKAEVPKAAAPKQGMMGINVRSDTTAGIRYADSIVDGKKLYESRNSDSLRPYVGKRIAIVRTGEGKAKAIGEVTVGEPILVDETKFRELQSQHLVPPGSTFDIKPNSQKYLYPMQNAVRYDTEQDVGAGIVSRKVLTKSPETGK